MDADRSVLARGHNPVVLVVRINGQIGRWERLDLARRSLTLVEQWRAAGIPVAGLEIDHDCATGRVDAYGHFLAGLRHEARSASLRLSMTALPSWTGSRALRHRPMGLRFSVAPDFPAASRRLWAVRTDMFLRSVKSHRVAFAAGGMAVGIAAAWFVSRRRRLAAFRKRQEPQ